MRALLGLIGATLGGWLGWWLGDFANIWLALFLSVVGTAFGGYYAKRWADENF